MMLKVLTAAVTLAAAATGCFDVAAERDFGSINHGSAGREINEMETTTGVKLEIRPESAEDAKGKVIVVATLRNEGKGPVWVNKRMLWNNPNTAAKFRELWFEVISPEGKALEFTCKVKAGFAKDSDYAVLQATENVTANVELSKCYKFDKAGAYKVKAFYMDSNGDEHKAPGDTPHLAQMLTSNVVSIDR